MQQLNQPYTKDCLIRSGEQTKNPKEAQKVEWYVKPYSSSKDEHTIQNLP